MSEYKKPLDAIHAFCCQCFMGPAWVIKCDNSGCPLWPFRMGKNPFRAAATEKQRETARENIKKARGAQKQGS